MHNRIRLSVAQRVLRLGQWLHPNRVYLHEDRAFHRGGIVPRTSVYVDGKLVADSITCRTTRDGR